MSQHDNKLVAKVSDFGMSREVNGNLHIYVFLNVPDEYYKSDDKGQMPVRVLFLFYIK